MCECGLLGIKLFCNIIQKFNDNSVLVLLRNSIISTLFVVCNLNYNDYKNNSKRYYVSKNLRRAHLTKATDDDQLCLMGLQSRHLPHALT